MKILSLDHITINVENLEASKNFYRNVLDLKEAGFIHMGDHTLTYYQLTPECRLELIDYLTPVSKANIDETAQCSYRHFCLETDNLAQVHRDCLDNQIFVRKAPSFVEKLGCDTMLIVDPNGVEIEIIQKQKN